MIMLVLASVNISLVPDHRLHAVMENPSHLSCFTSFAADHRRRRKVWSSSRGQQPARLFLSNISAVRHWNLPPGAVAIRPVGAVALATIPPPYPYDSILLKTVYHNADTGLIDFFPCKLVPDGARMPR
jgi:hypothetical protein